MRTRTLVAVFMFLATVLSAPQVWAQSDADLLRQIAKAAVTLSQRLEQPAQPAPATDCGLMAGVERATCVSEQALSRANAAHGRLDSLEPRVSKIESLVGRIAPRPSAVAPAPNTPKASQSAAPAAVSMTAPATERFLEIKFVGSEPNRTDLAKVLDLVSGGRYDLVDTVVLPTAGATAREKGHLSQARVNALRQDMANPSLSVRNPADSEEAAQLVAGASPSAGVVFHLRLKPAKVATAPTS